MGGESGETDGEAGHWEVHLRGNGKSSGREDDETISVRTEICGIGELGEVGYSGSRSTDPSRRVPPG